MLKINAELIFSSFGFTLGHTISIGLEQGDLKLQEKVGIKQKLK